jgi:bacillithiol biosynthesis cysteine-adding enzyme BshC
MDNAKFKSLFRSIIKKELTSGFSKSLIEETQKKIEDLGHTPQTHIRDINFFYRKDNLRNRIEKKGDQYIVVDSNIRFSAEEMENEIESHPERFSPNVIMRPLFQEFIFPNLAYIGGGGELAYWMERLSHFQSVDIPFPMLIRRTSGMISNESTISQLDKLGLNINLLFEDEHSLIKTYLQVSAAPDYQLTNIKEEIEKIFTKAHDEVVKVDKSLGKTTLAEKVKSIKSIEYLESKLKKSIKQKEESSLNRIKKLSNKYFPSNGLQERHDNILEYVSAYGTGIIDKMLEHCNPFDKKFKVFVMEKEDRI